MQLFPAPARRQDRCLALAGMLRAALEVQEMAHRGRTDSHILVLCIQSILSLQAPDSISALGGLPGLHRPLQKVCPFLHRGPVHAGEAEIFRHALALGRLGKRLLQTPQSLDRLYRGIEQARRQIDHFGEVLHPSVLAGLAETYAEGIGTLRPRIIVTGDSRFLTRQEDTARVRTLLLSGVRAAVLWRQSGGTFPYTLLERRALCETSRELLGHLPGHTG